MAPVTLSKKLFNYFALYVAAGLGIFFGSIIMKGLFNFLSMFIVSQSAPHVFYWISIIPLGILVGCSICTYRIYVKGLKDIFSFNRFGIKEFSLMFAVASMIPLIEMSLLLVWAWLSIAIRG